MGAHGRLLNPTWMFPECSPNAWMFPSCAVRGVSMRSPAVDDVAEALSQRLGLSVSANLYVTPGGAQVWHPNTRAIQNILTPAAPYLHQYYAYFTTITHISPLLRTFHRYYAYFTNITHISPILRIFHQYYAYFTDITHISPLLRIFHH
jgi:hypothetical protein